MSALCLRCDWVGEEGGAACPRCGARLYHETVGPPPEEPARPEPVVEPAGSPAEEGDTEAPSAPVRAPTSVRAALAVAAIFAVAIVVVLSLGEEPPQGSSRDLPPLLTPGDGAGLVVYAVPDGSGAARLWLWPVGGGDVRAGPLIREPTELVTVRSPTYGWLGFTADLGNGVREASVLGSLDRRAEPRTIGDGQLVSWTRGGATAVFVRRGPVRGACRRHVTVAARSVDAEGEQPILDDTFCGDVLSVGRTTLGYFLTRERADGADVVGAGYEDAGILLAGYGLIGISPGGEMLVTRSAGFEAGGPGRSPSVAGPVSRFDLFGGQPEPYRDRGEALQVDDVLAYSPGSTTALVIGRLPGGGPGLWELPLGTAGSTSERPRYVGRTLGRTEATYAADGTAYVMTGGSLWSLRDHRLQPIGLPDDAPRPSGPIVWILREPVTAL